MLNEEDGVQASIEVVGGGRRLSVLSRLSDKMVRSYELQKGLNKIKSEKAPGVDQSAEEFIIRKEEHGCLLRAIVYLSF